MTISYAPGSWILIAGRAVNVLLPEGEKQRAAAVWAAIDSGAGFSEALDAIVSAGLAGLSGFALVANDGDVTRAVVRGDLKVELRTAHDTTVVTGSGTWSEESRTGVDGVSVWAEAADSRRLSIEEGLVRAAGYESGTAVAAPEAPVAAPVQAPVLSLVPTAAPYAVGLPSVEPDFEADVEDFETDPEAVDEIADEPVEADGAWDETDETDAADEPLDESELLDDEHPTDDFGALGIAAEPTVADLPSDIPPPPAFPPPAYAPSHDVAPEPEAAQAPEPVAQPLRLAFSHGDNVEVTAPVVVGRAPHPDRFSHLADPLVVRVPSPHQEISGTHVAIGPNDADTVQVTDLGSTNGTLVIRGGGAPEELRPGVGVTIGRGDVIDLGDGLTIRVV